MSVNATTPCRFEGMKPPVTQTGALGWIKNNLFNDWFNSLLTILVVITLIKTVPPMLNWVFFDSMWFTTGAECQECSGACWSVITNNIRFISFGFYPYEEQWRPMVCIVILFGLLIASRFRSLWSRSLGYAWGSGIIAMAILMCGGIFGLEPVESDLWSGVPLTLLLSVFGLFAAYPLGILLALGRQSRMPVIKSFSVVYIELIRGVPLISLLFMSSVMFPLFLPQGITVNKILRALVAIILFTAAYIAEVVRGGLQAVDRGQLEAADSLGLTYWQKMRLIILPQALKIVIPPTVGVLIGAFKDTSLVMIIALYDILLTTQSVLGKPEWLQFSAEVYLFLALIYFVCCYAMSNFSRELEKNNSYKQQS